MARCPNCGSENSDDSKFCAKCGSQLSTLASAPARNQDTTREQRRRERQEVFGTQRSFWPLLIGVAIVLWGISEIVQMYYHIDFPWWPIILILVGLFMVASALSR